MAVRDGADLLQHQGHRLEIAAYGAKGEQPANVTLECVDCGEVLWEPPLDDDDEVRGEWTLVGSTIGDWIAYGMSLGYCSAECCDTHNVTPMHPSEEQAREEGWDPCCHVVRLGRPEDWDVSSSNGLTDGSPLT